MLHITALMDNKPSENKALIAEHGLSMYLEYNGHKVLFDCGSGPNPLANAHRLGVDLHDLEAVVLSHSHYDHAAGYRDLTEQGMGSPLLYTGPGFFEKKFAQEDMRCTDLSAGFDPHFLEEHHITHETVVGCREILPGVHLIGGFPRVYEFEKIPQRFVRQKEEGLVSDDFGDEICIALDVEGGVAVLVGCAHPGILNMVTHVHNLLGKPIQAVFGGTHLVEADESRIDTTVDALHTMGVEHFGLSHCSGEKVDCAIAGRNHLHGCHLATGDNFFMD